MAGRIFNWLINELPRSYIRERNTRAVMVAIVMLVLVGYGVFLQRGEKVVRTEELSATAVRRLCKQQSRTDTCMVEMRVPSGELLTVGMNRPWPAPGDEVPLVVEHMSDGSKWYQVKTFAWEMGEIDR